MVSYYLQGVISIPGFWKEMLLSSSYITINVHIKDFLVSPDFPHD